MFKQYVTKKNKKLTTKKAKKHTTKKAKKHTTKKAEEPTTKKGKKHTTKKTEDPTSKMVKKHTTKKTKKHTIKKAKEPTTKKTKKHTIAHKQEYQGACNQWACNQGVHSHEIQGAHKPRKQRRLDHRDQIPYNKECQWEHDLEGQENHNKPVMEPTIKKSNDSTTNKPRKSLSQWTKRLNSWRP